MTREKAIEILHFQTFVVDFQTEKALEMAISALRQQETVTNRNGLNEQMTNAQKIRSMSDEELAEFLIDLADDGNLKIREWLKQPAEEDKHENLD